MMMMMMMSGTIWRHRSAPWLAGEENLIPQFSWLNLISSPVGEFPFLSKTPSSDTMSCYVSLSLCFSSSSYERSRLTDLLQCAVRRSCLQTFCSNHLTLDSCSGMPILKKKKKYFFKTQHNDAFFLKLWGMYNSRRIISLKWHVYIGIHRYIRIVFHIEPSSKQADSLTSVYSFIN